VQTGNAERGGSLPHHFALTLYCGTARLAANDSREYCFAKQALRNGVGMPRSPNFVVRWFREVRRSTPPRKTGLFREESVSTEQQAAILVCSQIRARFLLKTDYKQTANGRSEQALIPCL
jgi:hypothetical protein